MNAAVRSIALILCGIVPAVAARAGDAPTPSLVAPLRAAGIGVNPVKEGGWAIDVKSAAILNDEQWKRIDELGDVKRFACGGKEFDDAALGRLVKLKSLETIFLNGPSITDDGLALLTKLPNLHSFGVHHSTVLRGTGVTALRDMPSLTAIEFGGSTVNDEGVKAMATLTQLKEVRLGHCRNSRASFPALAGLPNLQTVELTPNWDPAAYTIADLSAFAGCPHLGEVEVHDMLLPFRGGTDAFTRFNSLKTLKLYWCYATPQDLSLLRAAMPNVKIDYDHAADPQRVAEARKRMAEYESTKGR